MNITLALSIIEANQLWYLLTEAIDQNDFDAATWVELKDRLEAAIKQKMGTR